MIAILVALTLAAQDTPRFRAGVNVVRVDVGVIAGTSAVEGLTANDFEVRDNGDLVAVQSVVQEDAPLDVWLLFDISGSMEDAVTAVARSAREALVALREGDRAGVAVFTGRLRRILDPTDDLREVEYAIKYGVLKQNFSGDTHIQSSIFRLAREWSEEAPGQRRRAILVITDNQGDRTMKDREVIERLWAADAIACGLVASSGGRAPKRKKGVDEIVEESGCEMVNTGSPEADFPALMKKVRSRYAVYYALPPGRPGEERRVEVNLSKATRKRIGEFRVLARKGYVAPAEGTEAAR